MEGERLALSAALRMPASNRKTPRVFFFLVLQIKFSPLVNSQTWNPSMMRINR